MITRVAERISATRERANSGGRDAFDQVRLKVQNEILARCLDEEMAMYTGDDKRRLGEGTLKAKVQADCKKRIEKRVKGLRDKRWSLFARSKNFKYRDQFTVKGLLGLYPELKEAYDLKNVGLEILEEKVEKEAKAAFKHWELLVDASPLKPYFEPVVNLSQKCRKELIHYILSERSLRNAKIESAIFVLKMRNRMGRGLSFPMLRASSDGSLHSTAFPAVPSVLLMSVP